MKVHENDAKTKKREKYDKSDKRLVRIYLKIGKKANDGGGLVL